MSILKYGESSLGQNTIGYFNNHAMLAESYSSVNSLGCTDGSSLGYTEQMLCFLWIRLGNFRHFWHNFCNGICCGFDGKWADLNARRRFLLLFLLRLLLFLLFLFFFVFFFGSLFLGGRMGLSLGGFSWLLFLNYLLHNLDRFLLHNSLDNGLLDDDSFDFWFLDDNSFDFRFLLNNSLDCWCSISDSVDVSNW